VLPTMQLRIFQEFWSNFKPDPGMEKMIFKVFFWFFKTQNLESSNFLMVFEY